MVCGAKYATGVTTASIWRFWNLCVKGTAEAMDKVEKMLNCFSAADPEIFQMMRGGGIEVKIFEQFLVYSRYKNA